MVTSAAAFSALVDSRRGPENSSVRGPTFGDVVPADVHKIDPRNNFLGHAESGSEMFLTADYRLPALDGATRFAELMEVQRQTGLAHVHRVLGVEHGQALVLDAIKLRIVDPEVLGESNIRQGISNAHLVRSELRSAHVAHRFTLERSGHVFASGTSKATIVPPRVLARIRAHSGMHQATDAGAYDVATARATTSAAIVVDENDLLLRDHQSDHLSALALSCAIEKLVCEPTGALVALSLAFSSFIELSPAPTFRYRLESSGAFAGVVEQDGTRRATAQGRVWRGLEPTAVTA